MPFDNMRDSRLVWGKCGFLGWAIVRWHSFGRHSTVRAYVKTAMKEYQQSFFCCCEIMYNVRSDEKLRQPCKATLVALASLHYIRMYSDIQRVDLYLPKANLQTFPFAQAASACHILPLTNISKGEPTHVHFVEDGKSPQLGRRSLANHFIRAPPSPSVSCCSFQQNECPPCIDNVV